MRRRTGRGAAAGGAARQRPARCGDAEACRRRGCRRNARAPPAGSVDVPVRTAGLGSASRCAACRRGGVGRLGNACGGRTSAMLDARREKPRCRPAHPTAPAAVVRLAASCGVAKSSVQLRAVVIGMIPPQTEQRARMPGPGTRAGSTRNTDWHSGHETFMTRRPG